MSRRRLLAAAIVVAVLAALAGAGVAVLGGEDSEPLPEAGSGFRGGVESRRDDEGRKARGRARAPAPDARDVAQLFAVGFSGTIPASPFFVRLQERGWGAVVLDRRNYVEPGQLATLSGEIAVVARNAGFPEPIVAARQEGGRLSAFADLPPHVAQPQIRTSRRARAEAFAAGEQLRNLGIELVLAPNADVAIEGGPADGRAFDEDPRRVVSLVRAAVEGYRRAGIASGVGRFPGVGAASQDPEDGIATVGQPLDDLIERDVRPFAAIARRAQVIVVSSAVYAAYDGVTPAVHLRPVVEGLLRGRLGFRGVVMSDNLTAATAVTGEGIGQAAVDALKAGIDLLYIPAGTREQEVAHRAVLAALRKGELSRARVAQAVRRVAALRRQVTGRVG